jgi:Holliday junction resolvase RusA-like endonuclease
MSLIIQFEIDDIPPSVNTIWKRSKTGIYCSPKVLLFKDYVYYILKQKTFEKTSKNVKLEISFYVKNKRRDIDNLLKVLLDSMNKIIYDDDKQIIELIVHKIIGQENKTNVKVCEIETT